MFSWSSPSIPQLTSNDTNINPLGRPITSYEESLIASLPTFGSILGTVIAGFIAEKLGRKKTLIIFSMPFFFCYLIIAFSRTVYLFYMTRLVLGLAAGCVLSVLPSYLGEISEDSNRGAIGSFFGIMNSVGHFLSYGIGPLVDIQTFAFILIVPVSLFLLTFIPFVPESPYYFLNKDDTRRAKLSLKMLRSNSNIDKELEYLKAVVKEAHNNKISLRELTSSVVTVRGLIVCCGLLLFQQLMGIGVILLYLQPILNAGGNILPSYIASLIIAVFQMLSCILATFLIDRLGRKTLLHISSGGCSISMFALGMYFLLSEYKHDLQVVFWLPTTSLILFNVFFNLGYATIPWTICGEVFATDVKSLCASFAACLCLIVSFLISVCFPFIRDAFGMGGVFILFGALGALASVFVILYVPETKGRSFQEIQNELSRKHKVEDCRYEDDSS